MAILASIFRQEHFFVKGVVGAAAACPVAHSLVRVSLPLDSQRLKRFSQAAAPARGIASIGALSTAVATAATDRGRCRRT